MNKKTLHTQFSLGVPCEKSFQMHDDLSQTEIFFSVSEDPNSNLFETVMITTPNGCFTVNRDELFHAFDVIFSLESTWFGKGISKK